MNINANSITFCAICVVVKTACTHFVNCCEGIACSVSLRMGAVAGRLRTFSAASRTLGDSNQSRQVTCAAKSAILPPLGLIQLGMVMLWSVRDKESRRRGFPSDAIVIFEDDPVGVEGRVECRDEGWTVELEDVVMSRVCEWGWG